MCRDRVSMPKTDSFQSAGETFKVTFLTAEEAPVTIDCPDDMYILDAAEAAGLAWAEAHCVSTIYIETGGDSEPARTPT